MTAVYTQNSVLAALQVFQLAPEKDAIDRASTFLSDFQHSAEAWAICNSLLLAPDSPGPVRIFAAQTFRTKVIYDLVQLDQSQLFALKETILTALDHSQTGPKAIQTQLSLAVSALALQLMQWIEPIQNIIQRYSHNPAAVPLLLEFLRVLPEEINGNTKIPVSDTDFRVRSVSLLTDNAAQVLQLLVLYAQAPGVTIDIQSQVFQCLRSWVNSGEILVAAVAQTALLQFSFQALSSPDLFDSAVDLICDIIHETQEVYDNEDVIKDLLPKIINLRSHLREAVGDSDKFRGYTRIFAEAGETYRQLIVQHPDTFYPIVEAIAECTSYKDLDIVPITFHFWYRLAQSIGKQNEASQVFQQAYAALMQIIILHLHFPPESVELSGQEADDFRAFRHFMGDTLKDCCYVLGSGICLNKAYEMIKVVLAEGSGGGNVPWQAIEAPLFAMRSMGAEVDFREDKIIPLIMDLLPNLPNHPRIHYAAILVVSRYTEWINLHPTYIPFLLSYLSSGFENPESEETAAAAQAMKYLCRDCRKHLADSLPQLHSFINTIGSKLNQVDRLQIYEAIAHIISSMPMELAASSLRTFSFELLEKIHTITAKSSPVSKDDLTAIENTLEQLEILLEVVDTFGEDQPLSCRNAHAEAWGLFDPLLRKYGNSMDVTERITRVLRFGIQFFGSTIAPLVPSVLETLSYSFDQTGYSSCMWIAGKLIQRFGTTEEQVIITSIRSTYDRMSQKTAELLQTTDPRTLPDVVGDFIQLSQAMIDYAPETLMSSPGLETAFLNCLVAMKLVHTDIIVSALDFLFVVLRLTRPQDDQSSYTLRVNEMFTVHGFQLLNQLLEGMLGNFHEESLSTVIALFRCIAEQWPSELSGWLPSLMDALPGNLCSQQLKSKFIADCTSAISKSQPEKVKHAVASLFRACRTARERRDLKFG